MKEENIKKQRRLRRLARTRKKILQTGGKLRLSVFRSNMHLYAQVIDDSKHITVLSVHEKEINAQDKLTKVQRAVALGKVLAQKAHEAKITDVVFDKGSYRYHGRVRAFADSAREGGLHF